VPPLSANLTLVRSYNSDTAIAPVQMEFKRDGALVEMMIQLMARMDRLEGNSKRAHPKQDSTVTDQRVIIVVKKGIL